MELIEGNERHEPNLAKIQGLNFGMSVFFL